MDSKTRPLLLSGTEVCTCPWNSGGAGCQIANVRKCCPLVKCPSCWCEQVWLAQFPIVFIIRDMWQVWKQLLSLSHFVLVKIVKSELTTDKNTCIYSVHGVSTSVNKKEALSLPFQTEVLIGSCGVLWFTFQFLKSGDFSDWFKDWILWKPWMSVNNLMAIHPIGVIWWWADRLSYENERFEKPLFMWIVKAIAKEYTLYPWFLVWVYLYLQFLGINDGKGPRGHIFSPKSQLLDWTSNPLLMQLSRQYVEHGHFLVWAPPKGK